MAPTVLNPKKGDKAVLFGGPDDCYTYGPEDTKMTGIQFARQKTACPEGIASTLDQCRNGILNRRDDRCSCMSPEGNPPAPPRRVDCPRE
jgi:hypothetical protein